MGRTQTSRRRHGKKDLFTWTGRMDKKKSLLPTQTRRKAKSFTTKNAKNAKEKKKLLLTAEERRGKALFNMDGQDREDKSFTTKNAKNAKEKQKLVLHGGGADGCTREAGRTVAATFRGSWLFHSASAWIPGVAMHLTLRAITGDCPYWFASLRDAPRWPRTVRGYVSNIRTHRSLLSWRGCYRLVCRFRGRGRER